MECNNCQIEVNEFYICQLCSDQNYLLCANCYFNKDENGNRLATDFTNHHNHIDGRYSNRIQIIEGDDKLYIDNNVTEKLIYKFHKFYCSRCETSFRDFEVNYICNNSFNIKRRCETLLCQNCYRKFVIKSIKPCEHTKFIRRRGLRIRNISNLDSFILMMSHVNGRSF